MSNIIKSFRVVETESPKKSSIEKETYTNEELSIIEKEIEDKILEAEEEATRIILEAESRSEEELIAAEFQVKRIREKAEAETLVIKEEARISGYNYGFNEGNQKGYSEGYDKGFSKGKEDSQVLIEEAIDVKNNMIEERDRVLGELEGEIIDLIISIVKKVLGNVVESTEEYIVELVASGIKNLDPTDKLTIITSKEDYNVLKEYRSRILAEASLINELEIKYDINFTRGDCILETSKGSIDLSLKDQLGEVETLLNNILNNE